MFLHKSISYVFAGKWVSKKNGCKYSRNKDDRSPSSVRVPEVASSKRSNLLQIQRGGHGGSSFSVSTTQKGRPSLQTAPQSEQGLSGQATEDAPSAVGDICSWGLLPQYAKIMVAVSTTSGQMVVKTEKETPRGPPYHVSIESAQE